MRTPTYQGFRVTLRNLVFQFVPSFILPSKIKALKNWYRDNDEVDSRYEYSLNDDSVVFDLGGYEGEWSQNIWDRFKCNIHIFEPVHQYAQQIQHRFRKNSKIIIYDFGLAEKDSSLTIYVNEESSSTFTKKGIPQDIRLVDIIDFIHSKKISKIDLLKMNIEGGEYELLKRIIDSGIIVKIKNIQIQFHDFIDGAETKRNLLQESLRKTHTMSYCYPFVWESWHLSE